MIVKISNQPYSSRYEFAASMALNLLRQEPSKGSLTMKCDRAGLDDQFMLQILSANIPQSDTHSQLDF
jgi:hypothetical protein